MSDVITPRTLDQRRATHAWEVIVQVKCLAQAEQEQFHIQVKRLPTRIMAAGLGQALAFLEAQQYAPKLREALDDWMQVRKPTRHEPRLVLRIISGDADFLRFATAECLAYLQWLVRFADASQLTEA